MFTILLLLKTFFLYFFLYLRTTLTAFYSLEKLKILSILLQVKCEKAKKISMGYIGLAHNKIWLTFLQFNKYEYYYIKHYYI